MNLALGAVLSGRPVDRRRRANASARPSPGRLVLDCPRGGAQITVTVLANAMPRP